MSRGAGFLKIAPSSGTKRKQSGFVFQVESRESQSEYAMLNSDTTATPLCPRLESNMPYDQLGPKSKSLSSINADSGEI